MEASEEQVCSIKCVLKLCLLMLATLCSLAKMAISVYAWFGDPGGLALLDSVPSALSSHQLPGAPAEWTRALWPLLFAWELVWLMWVWLLLCRRHAPHIIVLVFYPVYILTCLLHIGCVFALGRREQEVTFALVAVLTFSLLLCVALLTGYLYYIRGPLKCYYPATFRLTQILLVNGVTAYATFTLVSLLFLLGALLMRHTSLPVDTLSSIILSLLSSLTVTYFLLEASILDRFLRHVFTVYPVVLWVLAGVLVDTWGRDDQTNQRNQLFALVLACVVGGLMLVRGVLWCVFACIRPLPDYERDEPDSLPL